MNAVPVPHRVRGDLEAGVPGQQRLLGGVEDPLEHRRGQHDQRRAAEAESVRHRDQRGAGQRHRAARPPPPARALAQERHRQQAGVDRRGRHQQAGRARGHHLLSGVEQQLVPVIPASPHSAISGRSLARGLRTPSSGAASASASDATASRATASPAGPSPRTATVMAGKALAQSSTVPAAARFAELLSCRQVSSRSYLTSSYKSIVTAKLSFMIDVRRLRVLHAVSAYGSVPRPPPRSATRPPPSPSSSPPWNGRWG